MTTATGVDGILLFGADLATPLGGPFLDGTAAWFARPCPGQEGPNEDSAALIPLTRNRGLVMVADGVGGMPHGDKASRTAVEAISECARTALAVGDSISQALLDGIDAANLRVSALGGGAATTLALVDLAPGEIRSYHVGDSEILVVGQRGRIAHLTTSHSPVGYGVHAGLIDAADALVHEDRHLVLNTIGSPDMRIEVGPRVRLHPRDTVLIGSDGLFDNLHLDEIVATIRKGPLDRVARTLVERCTARMAAAGDPCKPDDLTFVLLRPGTGWHPKSKAIGSSP